MGITPKHLAPKHWFIARPVVKDPIAPVAQRYIRLGECNQCGQCCAGTDPFAKVEGQCSQLHYDNKTGLLLCKVHQTGNQFWIGACKDWPRKPSDIWQYPKCSFSFVEESNAVSD